MSWSNYIYFVIAIITDLFGYQTLAILIMLYTISENINKKKEAGK